MLRIRLQRVGRKHEPTFRVVLTESTNSTKSGRFLEVLGSHDSRNDKGQLNVERIKEWIGKGAKVTDTIHNLLVSKNIISGKKINVLPLKSPPVAEKSEEKADMPKEAEVTAMDEKAKEAEEGEEAPSEEKKEEVKPE